MAIRVRFKQKENILEEIRELIYSEKVRKWSIDSDDDLTLLIPEWHCKAWMRIKPIKNDPKCVVFGIVTSQLYPLTKSIYAIYHSRLAELLLTHFDTDIETMEISALLVKGEDEFAE